MQSVDLDGAEVKPRGSTEYVELPEYEPWLSFLPWFDAHWHSGDHVAIVGMTGSGKTTLAREILKIRDFAVVFGTKPRDDSLYKPLEAKGFVRVDSWDPYQWRETGERYVIFAPELNITESPTRRELDDAIAEQSDAFRVALAQIYRAGGWAVYFDELAYIANEMALQHWLNLLWLQGRSLGVTIIAATQRPRSVPLNMFAQASWFFLWRIGDREDRRRAAEMTGMLAPVVFETAGMMPRFEFVAVNKTDDEIVRSRVALD